MSRDEDTDDRFRRMYRRELEVRRSALGALDPADPAATAAMAAAVHPLIGGAGAVGLFELGVLCRTVEQRLRRLESDGLSPDAEPALLKFLAILDDVSEALGEHRAPDIDAIHALALELAPDPEG
ncbi:MAG: Hpt domain-containing protein [Deltaproteobacteria bacterium]|nr:Hpt domain-containing protein [Deltaproteobacteria bacterium]MCB9786375.1 Hpt domain-containing protein [Deltaproteobacteria bacterium]